MARGSVYKRGSKWYAIYHLPNGKQVWKSCGDNKADAEAYLAKVNGDIARGTHREIREARLDDFVTDWLKNYASVSVKPSTYRSYEIIVRRHIIPYWGRIKLSQITPMQVQAFVADRVATGLSPKSVTHILVLFKKMLNDAVTWGNLASNPAKSIKKPRPEHRETECLTPEECRRLIAATPKAHRALVVTAILTAGRRGELLALKWGDIDWGVNGVGGRILIRRSLWGGKEQTPKSRTSIRSIPLSPRLSETLTEHRLTTPPTDGDYIFRKENGLPLDPDDFVKRVFQPALRRAGLRHIRFHDLRHTGASLLLSQGESVKYVAQVLGHSNPSITLSTYVHVLPETGTQAARKLDEQVFGDGNLQDGDAKTA